MQFKKKPYKRNDRLSKEIKILLSDFILKNLNLEGTGIITITKINVSRDLSNAKVYYSVINNKISKQELSDYLNKKSKFLKGLVGKKIRSKNIPELSFYFDNSIEEYEKIDNMLLRLNDR